MAARRRRRHDRRRPARGREARAGRSGGRGRLGPRGHGHAADEVDRYLAGHDSGSATPIHNPEYATLNNWYTVLVALQANVVAEGERLVILNSDLFASAGWFAEFIVDSASTDSDSLIAVDVERTLTDESMKVAAVEGGGRQLLSVIGKVAVEDPVGEYVGMLMAGGPA